MSPKSPPFIFFDILQQNECLKSFFLDFSRLPLNYRIFCSFSENFLLKTPKSHPSIFWNFATFTVSGIVTLFKRNNFRVKISFSQVRHAISDFCCFKRPVFFVCDFFKNLFHRSPPQFLPETKRFARVKDSSRFSALCDLLETIKNIFVFIFFLQFSVFDIILDLKRSVCKKKEDKPNTW